MLADQVARVIGVDTHRDRHVLAVIEAGTGELVARAWVSADAAGYAAAAALAVEQAPCAFAIEGSGSYGAGLARHLAGAGHMVVALDRPSRILAPVAAKSDELDAARIGRAALAAVHPAHPRAGGPREALRVLMIARAAQIETRARALTRIRALVVSAPQQLRTLLSAPGLGRTGLLGACAALGPGDPRDPMQVATASALCSLGRTGLQASAEAAAAERAIAALVAEMAPGLLDEPGVGPISAAQLILSWSHPGRIRSEAAFARLAGAAPIPASSGRRVRHRLDRGGDRQLNRALHTILLIRRRRDPGTQAYIARRIAEGKTSREAIRCLKRYLARHLFRLLEGMPTAA